MTTADTDTSATDTDVDTADTSATDIDWKAEAERLKSLARKWEDRSKANADAKKELDALKQQTMSDTERAVAEAAEAARRETVAMFAGKLVDAEIRAAAAGRNLDVDALLEGIDKTKFIGDDAEPNREAIVAWLDKVAPISDQQKAAPDLGQGARPVGGQHPALNSSQLERDLKAALGVR